MLNYARKCPTDWYDLIVAGAQTVLFTTHTSDGRMLTPKVIIYTNYY